MNLPAIYTASLALYGFSALAHLARSLGRLANANLGKMLLYLAFFAHTAYLYGVWRLTGVPPFHSVHLLLSLFAWFIVLLYLTLIIRYEFESLSFFTLIVVALYVLPTAVIGLPQLDAPAHRPASAALSHILLSLFSYAAFTFAALMAAAYLIEHRRLKLAKSVGVIFKLPSLEVLDKIQYKMIRGGLAAMAAGMAVGVLSSTAIGLASLPEPKLVVTVLVFLMFLSLAILRRRWGFSRNIFASTVLIGYALCLISLAVIGVLARRGG